MSTMKKVANFTNFPPLDYAGTEAFNTLTTNLSLCGANIRCIMVTSCHESEGKSFTSLNIARTLAGLGHNVALVDADIRRSVMISRYGIKGVEPKRSNGLVHYLAGMCEAEDVLYGTNIEGMYYVPIGQTVMNSLALLNNTRMSDLVQYLLGFMNYVIVDAPPVGVIIDAAEIARYCDGTLFVVSYKSVQRKELAEARQQIERTGCPILGAALNNVAFDSYSNKNYYYKSHYSNYGYYQSDGSKTADPAKKRRADSIL